jgi:hypothetical protein
MKGVAIAAIALSLLAGCSSNKVSSHAGGLVPEVQSPVSQAAAPMSQSVAFVQTPTPMPTAQWINLGNNGVVNLSYQATASTSQDHHYWVKVDFKQVLPDGTHTQFMLQAPQCSQGIYYTRYLINLSSSGQVIRQGMPDDMAISTTADPDSLAGDAFRIACSTH